MRRAVGLGLNVQKRGVGTWLCTDVGWKLIQKLNIGPWCLKIGGEGIVNPDEEEE